MNSSIHYNEVINGLHARKSVRVFEDRPVSSDVKHEILLAAAAAPTAGNQQLYTILDITDGDLKKQLSKTCDNQPFIAKAPFVLVFCADCQKWYDAYKEVCHIPRKPSAGDLMLAVEDCSIAAQNAVTAAWSLGVGSCYIGDIMEHCETHRTLFHLPPFVFPAVMVVFGYPVRQQMEREKPKRCDLHHIVMENTYKTRENEALRQMFAYKAGQLPYEEWLTGFYKRKYHSGFALEMGRSVEEYLKNFL